MTGCIFEPAFLQGRKARKEGQRFTDNPHVAGSLEAVTWEEGYLFEDKQQREKTREKGAK